jgi:metal-dependent amidase/aminoacylase/carboxypeptidase family protein
MDALPGIGHACGHNLIAISGVAVALAMAYALKTHDIPGTVLLLGTPGKCLLMSNNMFIPIK